MARAEERELLLCRRLKVRREAGPNRDDARNAPIAGRSQRNRQTRPAGKTGQVGPRFVDRETFPHVAVIRRDDPLRNRRVQPVVRIV